MKENFADKVKKFLILIMADKQRSYDSLIHAITDHFDCSMSKAKSAFSRLRTENFIKKENGKYLLN